MTDYMNAKTENVQKFLDNCLKRQKQELIEKIFRDMIFDRECYKMSIKDHNKWEERSKQK